MTFNPLFINFVPLSLFSLSHLSNTKSVHFLYSAFANKTCRSCETLQRTGTEEERGEAGRGDERGDVNTYWSAKLLGQCQRLSLIHI